MRFLTGFAVAVLLGLVIVLPNAAQACGGGCCCMMPMPNMKGMGNMPGMNMEGMPGLAMRNGGGKQAIGKTKRITLALSGMHCEECPEHVKEALTALPWVKQALVDLDEKEAIVIADASKYNEQALLKALKAAGFGGKVQK